MSSYAEPTALPVTCPVCEKQGRPSSYPGYHDLFNGERVVRAACTAHRHPIVDRRCTGSVKNNWGTVGQGPQAEPAETEGEAETPAEVARAARDVLAEMRKADAAEA